MDVGQVTEDSFDLHAIGETDAIIVRSADKVRWLYKDEQRRLIILEKMRTPPQAGCLVEIEKDGVGRCTESHTRTATTVGVLLEPFDDTTESREVTCEDGHTRNAYVQRVRLV